MYRQMAYENTSEDDVAARHESGILYLQLGSDIRQKILSGEYPIGSKIPTEQELCDKYDVSRITVRRAIQDLVEDGLLEKVRGKGTFVAVPKHVVGSSPTDQRSFTSLVMGEGPVIRNVVEKRLSKADKHFADMLGCEVGAPLCYVRRVVLDNNYPFAIDELIAPEQLFPGLIGLMQDNVSFYDLVENHYGIAFGSEDLTIGVTTARDDEGQLLRCNIGAPLFILKKLMRCADGTPMHYSKSILRGDRVSYKFTVDRFGNTLTSDTSMAPGGPATPRPSIN